MTEHPVFVETPIGVIGGIVTEPDGPPVAAAVVFGGLAATRSGNNSVWVRLSRALADIGVVSLRADYAGLAESQCAPFQARSEGIEHILGWFRERTPGLRLLVVGHCYGVVPARNVARVEPDLAGVAAISPALGAIQLRAAQRSRSLGRRVHVALYYAKKAVLRIAVRARYGRAPHKGRFEFEDLDVMSAPELITSLAATGRAWFLTGEGDNATEHLRDLEAEITATGSVLEVVPFMIYPTPTPEAQDEIVTRTVAWARQCIRAVEATG